MREQNVVVFIGAGDVKTSRRWLVE